LPATGHQFSSTRWLLSPVDLICSGSSAVFLPCRLKQKQLRSNNCALNREDEIMLFVSLQGSARLFLAGLLLAIPTLISAAEPPALNLAEAQARALAFSPNLAAADLGLLAASARRDQAKRRPNPGLEMEWENFGGSGELAGVDASEWTLAVSQVFDLSGKRGLLKDQISNEISLLEWDQKAAALDLRKEVGLAFAEVWFNQESVALVHERKELAILLQTELAEQLKVGGSSAIEVTRARVDVAAAEVALIHAREGFRTAVRRLISLWGGESPDFTEVILPPGFWDQTAVTLADANFQNNPDIARWESIRSLQKSRLKVAESANSIDLEVALGLKWINPTDDRAFVLGAGIPIPSSDRNQDEVRALGYELQQVGKLQSGIVNNLEAQLAAAVGHQTSARLEMDIMSQEIIPLAQQAYEETRAAHHRGLFSLTDVLATRNDLFDLRQAQLESQFSFFNATVLISRLTGRDFLEMPPVFLEEK
jgi:outer membrane protein, heavy metal efflux system